ncbi:hypothetical protein MC885_008301 [Smutsia gigantea]|nr:hypothetical protein MC885_008301 [Smutsia gigantea]
MGAMRTRGAQLTLCGVALLCALGLAQSSSGALLCGPGLLLLGTGTDARCCRSCASAEVCPEQSCMCVQPEYHCGDPQCQVCKHHPCPPGQGVRPQVQAPTDACPRRGPQGPGLPQVQVLGASETSVEWMRQLPLHPQRPHSLSACLSPGKFSFGFECVDCATGTFSEGREGRCKPWADCSRFGFPTMFPGNKTHNAVCSPGLPPAEPRGLLAVVLPTMVACVLVLTAAQLGLHIWQLKRSQERPPEIQLLPEALPASEDACSCQFPEEERGEQLSEDKGRLGHLWA